MDDIEAKVIETITQLNDEENLDIDFPESYIEDLSKAYVKNDLTDDELAQLIRRSWRGCWNSSCTICR